MTTHTTALPLEDAIDVIRRQLLSTFWIDRAAEMMRHLCISRSGGRSDVTDLRVDPAWPHPPAMIEFTRVADGQRYRLWLDGKTFRGDAARG